MPKWTPEQLEKQKERTINDAHRLREGASYVQGEHDAEPRIEITGRQLDKAKEEYKDGLKEEKELKNKKISMEIAKDIFSTLENEKLPRFPEGHTDRVTADPNRDLEQSWLKRAVYERKFTFGKDKMFHVWFDNYSARYEFSIRGIDLTEISDEQKKQIKEEIIDAVHEKAKELTEAWSKMPPHFLEKSHT